MDAEETISAQAQNLLTKFGGAQRLAEVFKAMGIERDPSVFYKWTYPKSKNGTGGVIPTNAWPLLIKAARMSGVLLTSEDFNPQTTTKLESNKGEIL